MNLAAVIVENRNVDMYEVVNRHLKYLPEYTKLYVYDTEPIRSINDYNKLLTSRSFWERITEENILIFQSDSGLLREGIEEFYQYDYVGASWSFYPFVGNGGLSFRKKSAMLKIIDSVSWTNNINEDIYFTHGCKLLNLNLAPIEVANKFSVETQYNLGSLGYHAIEKYLSLEQVNKIKTQYGEI